MKIRLIIALAGFAISLAFPTFAQEQKAVDPEVRQQIEAAYNKRVDAISRQDAAAVAACYTQDAVVVNAAGSGVALTSGQEAIKKWYEGQLSSGPPISDARILEMHPVGDNEICAISEYMWERHAHLHAVTIYVRDADEWKVRMLYSTR
jgi:ketosteroid isomerase-like protein